MIITTIKRAIINNHRGQGMKPRTAETVNYWKSSTTSPDKWFERTKQTIKSVGGTIEQSVMASDDRLGYEAFAIRFTLEDEVFAIKWPVLRSRSGKQAAARIQAATALYHDVKACVVRAQFLGARAAFATWLELPGGRTVAESTSEQLCEGLPKLLAGVREGP
jgi:hypothetical protein